MNGVDSVVAQIETMLAEPQRELARLENRLQANVSLSPALRAIRGASIGRLRAVVRVYQDVIDILQTAASPEPALKDDVTGVLPRDLERLENALVAWTRLEKMRGVDSFALLMSALQYVRENVRLVAATRDPNGGARRRRVRLPQTAQAFR
jgi:hypothetical protein